MIHRAALDLVYYSAVPAIQGVACDVRVNGSGLAIEAPSLPLTAYGLRVAPGHFMMLANDGTVGSLHRYPGGKTFEGSWMRRGAQGFWRVRPMRSKPSQPE